MLYTQTWIEFYIKYFNHHDFCTLEWIMCYRPNTLAEDVQLAEGTCRLSPLAWDLH